MVRYLLVLVLLGVGIALIVENRHAPSISVLAVSGGSILLAGLLADPADMKAALSTIMQYVPLIKR